MHNDNDVIMHSCYNIISALCLQWFAGEDGIHGDKRQHLMHTCRHKDLYLPPDSDPEQWEISFPSTEKFEQLMQGK